MMKKLKIGIFGVGRGAALGKSVMLAGADVVAVCDTNKEKLEKAVATFGENTATYDDFDKFIEHPMDGVIIANFFPFHAPYAIKCLEKGIHVLSECASNGTMAEGVALVRAAEKSNAIYMLGENYPHALVTREIKRVCEGGTLGKILYAEGEYNHPFDPASIKGRKALFPFPEHWRNYNPRTYYINHSLGPVMHATGATPKRVSAYAVFAPIEGAYPTAIQNGDRVAIVVTQNDDGSIFRVTGTAGFGGHHSSYRVCGTEGQVESVRGMKEKVMLRYNPWSLPAGAATEQLYTPSWNDKDEALITKTGHGGGDFIVVRKFLECIAEGKQPEFPFDVYSAVTMASVGMLAHRSMLEGGQPYDIPDFRCEEDRKKWENDYLTPYPGPNGEAPTLPCCSKKDFAPTEEQWELYRKLVMGIDED